MAIDLPVRATGISSDEFLLVDRLEVHLFGDDGRLLYRRANAGVSPESLAGQAGDPTNTLGFSKLTVDIPGNVYRRVGASATQLRMDYSLTLMKTLAEYKMAATDGSLRATEIGLCSSHLDEDSIAVRCSTIGRSLFCYSAALYGPDGRHNPEILKCAPDYRPYLPPPTNVLNFFGVDLPVRDPYGLAHYPVDASELPASYLRVKIYGERDHFKRTLVVSPFPVVSPHDPANTSF